ncbi:hypothetical protein QN277_004224 [Acacia crassicarpa]|uniref:Glycine-rich protein n=1 Tax=Acacia crassicarpa TaxID=499986 RepID=A0AAE1MDJ1_9FABA|nr:hypothetical protein QN277_004224 [Acacia crassicarpa]
MASTATSDIADGPVLSFVNKRIRSLRKKLNRILQMEESIAQGKTINKEQEEVLRSKPAVAALIDELEKLRQPLSAAVKEEVDLALQNHRISPDEQPQKADDFNHTVVEDLLNLLYFGSLFDVKSQNDFTSTMLTRTHERGCCLTYDYVTDDATDLLGEKDLDLISRLGGLLISRPADSSLSHKNALQRCIEHAMLWTAKADQPIESNADVTYAGLRERLNKIMSSEYFTTTPEMKVPVEVVAAAVGNYASFQVPVHDTIVPASVPVEVEGSDSPYQEKDEGAANFEGHESGDNQSDSEEELQKDEVEVENVAEVVSVQQEEVKTQADAEHTQRDSEEKEQQYFPRRGGYQNQRGGRGGGGGRRGYSNGRGGRGGGRGGGYYNGRNQYYDQSGNYYPRNYYNNRGRGGRGGGGGGHLYDNHGSGGQANHVADVGVRS